jgi:opacity protein-like surface antigen
MRVFFCVTLLVLSSAAHADGWSINLNAGRASTDVPQVTIPSDVAQNLSQRIDDSDTGLGLQVNYAFSASWRVAVGYVDLGEGERVIEADTLTPDQFTRLAQQTPVLASGVTAAVQYRLYQQDNIFMDVELGLFRWSADIRSTSSVGRARLDDNGTDVVWGARVGYKVDPNWHVHAGYQSYELDERIDFPHLGVTYQF